MNRLLYFQWYIQSAEPVPSTKVQVSSMIADTKLMTYQFTETLYTGPGDMPLSM